MPRKKAAALAANAKEIEVEAREPVETSFEEFRNKFQNCIEVTLSPTEKALKPFQDGVMQLEPLSDEQVKAMATEDPRELYNTAKLLGIATRPMFDTIDMFFSRYRNIFMAVRKVCAGKGEKAEKFRKLHKLPVWSKACQEIFDRSEQYIGRLLQDPNAKAQRKQAEKDALRERGHYLSFNSKKYETASDQKEAVGYVAKVFKAIIKAGETPDGLMTLLAARLGGKVENKDGKLVIEFPAPVVKAA